MLAWATSASAIAVGQLDTFQNGTTLDWVDALTGAIGPNLPVVVANAGPSGPGDFALRITGNGSVAGAGGKLVVNNVQPRWLGNYTAAGVNGILLDVRNPNGFALSLRVGIDGPAVGTSGWRWVSGAVVIPASSGWRSATFSLLPSELLPGNIAATNAATTLANVVVLRVMHAPDAIWTGAPVTGGMDLNDIEALPEPTAALSLFDGSLLLGSLRSLRRR